MAGVVVIDDDQLVRERVITSLEYNNMAAFGAPNGQIGVDMVYEYNPDLVLCDITMPVMDGYAVLDHLRGDARTATIPFVFMTALNERNNLRQGMQSGADDYLTKPFTADELLATVHTQLDKHHTLVEQHETTLKMLRQNINYALPHELRTPLAGSLGFAEMLVLDAEHYSPADVRELASKIVKYNKRLHRVLENFLIYAQIEVLAADQKQLAKLRNHITAHVGQVVEDSASDIADAHNRTSDLDLHIQDFAARISDDNLKRIVHELVDNAFKFSKPGDPVTVRVDRDQDAYFVTVRDHGRGMTAEQIATIGAYMQFDRLMHEQQGLGLGLIIAKRLIELHQGHLSIYSEPGNGTAMKVGFRLYD